MRNFIPVVIIISLVLSGCGKQSSDEKKSAEKTETVETQTTVHLDLERQREAGIKIKEVRMTSLKEKITVAGRVEYDQRRLAHVTSRVAGRVEQVFAYLGDRVKARQVLATIYSQEYLTAQSEFIQAEQRLEQLLARKDSTEELATARSIYQSARRKLLVIGATEDDLNDLAKNHAPKTLLEVRTPLGGTVVETNEILGHVVEVGTTLFHVTDISTIWLIVDFYEKDVAKVKTGIEVVAEVVAYPGEKFKGTLTRMFDVVDKDSRTIKGRAELNNPSGKLKPAMLATVLIGTQTTSEALVLPSQAVQIDGNARFVFVARDDTSFSKRLVSLGRQFEERVEIVEGLKQGERVVTSGAFVLKAEMLKSMFGEE